MLIMRFSRSLYKKRHRADFATGSRGSLYALQSNLAEHNLQATDELEAEIRQDQNNQ